VYQDVSTGVIVSELNTRHGRCDVLAQNPWNGVLHCGHTGGTVTLWAPNSGVPLAKILTHKGALTSVAVDNVGKLMATAGMDGQVKVWDLRNAFAPIHSYFSRSRPSDISFSQRGLLAVGWSSSVSVWKDVGVPNSKAKSPYMNHHIPEGHSVERVRFAPFEDVLGVGHMGGISSLVIPGSGEPNYDALEANPYITLRQRREAEVKQLLDKLPWDSITLDPQSFGALVTLSDDRKSRLPGSKARSVRAPVEDAQQEGGDGDPETEEGLQLREKKRMKGKNSSMKKYLRKQKNVMDAKKQRILDDLARERADKARRKRGVQLDPISPLDRFLPKRR
jgi:U3 small nucleolar RNA-associated protein 7